MDVQTIEIAQINEETHGDNRIECQDVFDVHRKVRSLTEIEQILVETWRNADLKDVGLAVVREL